MIPMPQRPSSFSFYAHLTMTNSTIKCRPRVKSTSSGFLLKNKVNFFTPGLLSGFTVLKGISSVGVILFFL